LAALFSGMAQLFDGRRVGSHGEDSGSAATAAPYPMGNETADRRIRQVLWAKACALRAP
jgi:hypothetical protein